MQLWGFRVWPQLQIGHKWQFVQILWLEWRDGWTWIQMARRRKRWRGCSDIPLTVISFDHKFAFEPFAELMALCCERASPLYALVRIAIESIRSLLASAVWLESKDTQLCQLNCYACEWFCPYSWKERIIFGILSIKKNKVENIMVS